VDGLTHYALEGEDRTKTIDIWLRPLAIETTPFVGHGLPADIAQRGLNSGKGSSTSNTQKITLHTASKAARRKQELN
jgi:hypothetical protein